TFATAISTSIRPRAMSGARERAAGGRDGGAAAVPEGRAAELFTAGLSLRRRRAGRSRRSGVAQNLALDRREHMRRTSRCPSWKGLPGWALPPRRRPAGPPPARPDAQTGSERSVAPLRRPEDPFDAPSTTVRLRCKII